MQEKKNLAIRTIDGCKQGEILSGYLFNFFLDKLLQQCVDLNIGCHVGTQNISIVAYCDDIFLMAETKQHIELLLKVVGDYARMEVKV